MPCIGAGESPSPLERERAEGDFWVFLRGWVRRAASSLERGDPFEGRIYLWVSFNAWAGQVVADRRLADQDRSLVRAAAWDELLSERFDLLVSEGANHRSCPVGFTAFGRFSKPGRSSTEALVPGVEPTTIRAMFSGRRAFARTWREEIGPQPASRCTSHQVSARGISPPGTFRLIGFTPWTRFTRSAAISSMVERPSGARATRSSWS